MTVAKGRNKRGFLNKMSSPMKDTNLNTSKHDGEEDDNADDNDGNEDHDEEEGNNIVDVIA